jgi:hypothetical protein
MTAKKTGSGKSSARKKLTLSKETLADIRRADAAHVRGGQKGNDNANSYKNAQTVWIYC